MLNPTSLLSVGPSALVRCRQAHATTKSLVGLVHSHCCRTDTKRVLCRLSSISCLLPLPNGALLTGGADRCVRYWEPSWPERSYIVAGPVWSDDTGIMEHATQKVQVSWPSQGTLFRAS